MLTVLTETDLPESIYARRVPHKPLDWNRSTVECLKDILRQRRLRVGDTKGELIERLVTRMASQSFTIFSRLPLELRRIVWKAALPVRLPISFITCTLLH